MITTPNFTQFYNEYCQEQYCEYCNTVNCHVRKR